MAVGNEKYSNISCAGGFITQNVYSSSLGQQKGKRTALNISRRDPTNWGAKTNRGIRMHGAWYVTDTMIKHSHGCVCCNQAVHEALIDIIKGGSFLFSYFGEDSIEV